MDNRFDDGGEEQREYEIESDNSAVNASRERHFVHVKRSFARSSLICFICCLFSPPPIEDDTLPDPFLIE